MFPFIPLQTTSHRLAGCGADVFEVSLDYLAGASEKQLNKEILNRIREVDKMKPDEKKMIYTFLDAFITKTKLQTIL